MSCYTNETCLNPSTGTAPQLFSSALQFFAAAQCLIKTESPADSEIYDCEEFDYIIVGAGTAGCVVANRLTEDSDVTVLLLEAGDTAPIEAQIPNLDKAIFFTKYDWQYLTSNDNRISQAHKNGSVIWPRGRMLGGSSGINGMFYVKGVQPDYDIWYDAGNIYWHSDIVQKYFKKAESYQYMELLKNPDVDKEYGDKGPLVINRFNSTYRALTEKILKSWDEIGVRRVVDINIPGVFKAGIVSAFAANGKRYSSDYAYIDPVKNRPNLNIRKNFLVTRILINRYNRAYGVEGKSQNGEKMKFRAKSEVIVCAGTVNTPQLLMLSGVGPENELKAKNITCKVNSPMVGKNLQDHFFIPITIYGNGSTAPDNATQYFGVMQYIYNRTGYLGQNSFSDILAFFSSTSNATRPEYEIHMAILWRNLSNIQSTFSNRFRFLEPIPSSIAELNKDHVLFLFQFSLLHPLSRGYITLNTSNPKDHPLIYPNYLLHPKDLDSTIKGIQFVTKLLTTKFFKSIGAFLGRISWPPCDKFRLNSYSYWKCICINTVLSIYHPVGTSRMGPNPETAVVDGRLRVYGVKNLRVIDASIMPNITSGNTNGPTTMIAERGADLVKEDRKSL